MNEIIDSSTDNNVSAWVDGIDAEATKAVECRDDGDRDNILENKPFARQFIRLCKMLPLWCAISVKHFNSPTIVGSSWSSETNFKNVKQLHEGNIPCRVDEFVQNDIRLIKSSIVKASQKYIGATVESSDVAPVSQKVTEMNSKEFWLRKRTSKNSKIPVVKSGSNSPPMKRQKASEVETIDQVKSITSCIACSDGNLPTGLHKCVTCLKSVHLFDECSKSIGDAEGCGEKRQCIECHNKVEPSHGKKKDKHIKRSIYMQPDKNFELVQIPSKLKIAHLQNGNLSKTVLTIHGEKIMLKNTCAFDSVAQLIAAAYTIVASYKSFVDRNTGELFKLVKLIASK